MPIVNRDKDTSEQKFAVSRRTGAMTTGLTFEFWVAPFPCTISAIEVAGIGKSGAPQWAVQNNRFIVGSGATVITGLAAAQAITAFSTSGMFGMALATSGSTLLNLQAGDLVEIVTSVSNTNFTDTNVVLVAKKTQDIVSWF